MSERDEIDYDRLDELAERRRHACRCGGDMPGRCPGPANCPMCQTDPDDDETEEQEG